jgi:aspergillopepsin I
VAGITVHNGIIESALSVSRSMIRDPNISGIVGLAFDQPSQVVPSQPTFLDLLDPVLDQRVFSVDFRWHNTGRYQFGTIDPGKYLGDITWVPLVDGAQFWEFEFTRLNIGGSSLWLISSWRAIADTGTTLMLLPKDLVALYYEQVPAATFNDTLQAWTFPCDTVMPDFHLGFGDGGGWFATVPGKYINYSPRSEQEPGSTNCYGGIQDNGGLDFSILGDVFLKAVFAVFDRGGGRIGFADKTLSA